MGKDVESEEEAFEMEIEQILDKSRLVRNFPWRGEPGHISKSQEEEFFLPKKSTFNWMMVIN